MKARRFSFTPLLLLLFGAVALHFSSVTTNAQGIWTNGQDAASVLGQLDFDNANANRGNLTPTANSLHGPAGIAIDPTTGKVFVSDFANNRVLRYSSTAALQTGASAEAVLGQPDFTSNTTATTRSRLSAPHGVFVNTLGALWVADRGNNRILRFDKASSKANGANADGVLGQPDFFSSSSATTAEGLSLPRMLVEDAAGRAWVVDGDNHRVLRYDSVSSKADGAPADGVLGQPNFTTGAAALSASGMDSPAAIEIGPDGELWIADASNNRILRFDNAAAKANGTTADGVLGQIDFTSNTSGRSASEITNPISVSLDPSGNLWIGEDGRALRFDSAASKGDGAAADFVLGEPDFATYSGPSPSRSNLLSLCVVKTFGNNRLWVVDYFGNRVLRFEADRSAELAAERAANLATLNAQISSTKRAIQKLKKKIKKAKRKGQLKKAKRLKKKLRKKKKALRSLQAQRAAL